jgi:membrane protease YdiL (CAAX protease family)
MEFDANPDAQWPETAPALPPAPPREPVTLLVAGILLYCCVLALSWYGSLKTPATAGVAVQAQTTRLMTYQVSALAYLARYSAHGSTGENPFAAGTARSLPRSARDAAKRWLEISTNKATLSNEYRAQARVNAAALYGLAGDDGRARNLLERAARTDARYAVLRALYAKPPHAITLTPTFRAQLARHSTGPLFFSRNAQLRGDTAAAKAALRPAYVAGVRVMVVFTLLGLGIVALLLAGLIGWLGWWKPIAAAAAEAGTPAPPVPWGVGTALALIGMTYLISDLISGLLLHLLHLRDQPTIAIVIGTLMLNVVSIFVIGGFLALHGRSPWDWGVLGWQRVPRGARLGLAGLVLALPFILALSLLSAKIFGAGNPHPLIPLVEQSDSALFQLYLALVAVVLAPLVEETLFRGLLFRALNTQMAFWPAAAISGAAFALGHAQPAALLPIFCLGMLFAFLTRRTGSLVPSATAHALFNAAGMTVALATGWLLRGPGG